MSGQGPSGPAAGYWVGDATGRVLGPLSLQALRDLVSSGRLRGASRASRDGQQWVTLAELSEVQDLLGTPRPSQAFELAQAERLRVQLRGLRDLGPAETFGVRPGASLDELRGAFFRLAKRFQPERLGADAHPELRAATAELFDLLSRRMREAEVRAGVAPQTAPPPPEAPAAARPAAATPPPATARARPSSPRVAAKPEAKPAYVPFTYDASEFVGLQRRDENRLHADIKCTPQSVGIFTDHRVMNLSSGGMFIATATPLKLGTRLNVALHFEEPPSKLELQGAVVWEHTLDDGKQPRGYGIRLDVRPAEREVLEDFVRRHRQN